MLTQNVVLTIGQPLLTDLLDDYCQQPPVSRLRYIVINGGYTVNREDI
jgi:hypothetical protein